MQVSWREGYGNEKERDERTLLVVGYTDEEK